MRAWPQESPQLNQNNFCKHHSLLVLTMTTTLMQLLALLYFISKGSYSWQWQTTKGRALSVLLSIITGNTDRSKNNMRTLSNIPFTLPHFGEEKFNTPNFLEFWYQRYWLFPSRFFFRPGYEMKCGHIYKRKLYWDWWWVGGSGDQREWALGDYAWVGRMHRLMVGGRVRGPCVSRKNDAPSLKQRVRGVSNKRIRWNSTA